MYLHRVIYITKFSILSDRLLPCQDKWFTWKFNKQNKIFFVYIKGTSKFLSLTYFTMTYIRIPFKLTVSPALSDDHFILLEKRVTELWRLYKVKNSSGDVGLVSQGLIWEVISEEKILYFHIGENDWKERFTVVEFFIKGQDVAEIQDQLRDQITIEKCNLPVWRW